MNLQGKINVIKNAKDNIKSAIIAKGITPTGNISTYANAINNIVTPNNQTKTVTENGVVRYDTGYTGLEQVTVSLPLNSKSITTNGTYNASADNLQGYNSVTVNVQPDVDTKTITANGTYNASSDNLDGYDEVIVNVPNSIDDLIDGSITEVDTNVSTIKNSAFKNCKDLDTVVLRSNTVVDLSDGSVFENTPIASKTGNIYVPDKLLFHYNLPVATQNTNLGNNGWMTTVYNGTEFIALGSLGCFSFSLDGLTWSDAVFDPFLSKESYWRGLACGNNKHIAIGGAYISTSFDGTAWTDPEIPVSWRNFSDIYWCDITFDGTQFIAIGTNDNYTYISTSTNGGLTNWTEPIFITSDYSLTSIAYGNGKYVGINEEGGVSTSTNGTTWTNPVIEIHSDSSLTRVVFDGTQFVALSISGWTATSTDGVNWTGCLISNLGNKGWWGLAYNGTNYIALSAGGYISNSSLSSYNFLPISQLPS